MWMLIAAIVAAGTFATFTDWLFMGVLFHRHYMTYPEIWWPQFREKGDSSAIIKSSMIGYVASAGVIGLCALAGTHGIQSALVISLVAWAAGPLVLTVTNGFWIRIDPLVTFAHCLGYLARFLIAGVAAGIVLS